MDHYAAQLRYEESAAWLRAQFREGKFIERARRGETNTQQARPDHNCQTGAHVTINFPGYKATVDGLHEPKFDYRVDFEKGGVSATLSHANIIIDIYNKISNNSWSIVDARRFIFRLFPEGPSPWTPAQLAGSYTPQAPPPKDLIARAAKGFGGFKPSGNKWDLDLEELNEALHWIILQEDINYPMSSILSRTRPQGRRMPLARYIEAIEAASTGRITIEEVVGRAENKGAGSVPSDLPGVDYRILSENRFQMNRESRTR